MNLLVSYNWLKEYVKVKVSPQEFAKRLSLSGPSIERIHPQGEGLDKVVVGKILKVKPHPNADKLRVVETDLGEMTKDIVCGGSNLKEGQLVATALPGAMVKWHGVGEPVEIKVAAPRGVESYGMICGADEVGLINLYPKKEEREVVDLTSTGAKPGTPLKDALGLDDVIFDVEVTTNRPDAFSMVGMARETAAILKTPLLWKPAASPKSQKKGAFLSLEVQVESKRLCPRYQAAVMRNVKVGPSPAWLKANLAASGIRSINNLVDITNFVMLELGQPMHVFDHAKLKGGRILVREAKTGESIKALDGNTYKLTSGQLVIADADRPIAVAGVMGGEETGVTGTTADIVFEAATFDAVSVRRTARALNLHSDSSLRFEKGLSTEQTSDALARAVALAAELAGAELAGPVVDARAAAYKPPVFPFRPAKASEMIGVDIPAAEMKRILTALGFGVSGPAAKWKVTVPYWRDHDIEGERDLGEEVARVYGYGNLPSIIPEGVPPLTDTAPAIVWEDRVKLALKGWGATEVMTYSFVSREMIENFGYEVTNALRLANPLTSDLEYMRTSLLPSMLQVIAKNQEEVAEGLAFELANVYLPKENDLPVEGPRLVVAAWSREADGSDFKKAKGLTWALLDEMGIHERRLERFTTTGVWHPGRSGELRLGDTPAGVVGEIHPALLSKFGVERRVAIARLDFSVLLRFASRKMRYEPIPEFPPVKRDLAFTVDKDIEHATIKGKMLDADRLLRSADLFDIFEDGKLGHRKKSMAYHLVFAAPERTLTAEEVEAVMDRLRATLKKEFGAEIRG
jgi:phenylalanyl-tRNA synthetase beta chain